MEKTVEEKKDYTVKNLLASLLVAAVGCLAYWAYDAQMRVDEYNDRVNNLITTMEAIQIKQSTDQESNLKDLEENRIVESKVKTLEILVTEQESKIVQIQEKMAKGKKK